MNLTTTVSIHSYRGHTDNNGTQTYNMSLGNERAQSVKKILLSCGVNKNQIKTVSYGKGIC